MAEINVTDTNQRRTQARILDVREDVEVASGIIPGALHMPLSEIPTRVDELEQNTPSSSSAAAATAPPTSQTPSPQQASLPTP